MGLEKCLSFILSVYTRRLILIHIVESKAYKSDSDHSLRSYYDRLRERIEAADFNVNNLTLEIKETLEYINTVNEMLEEFRVELIGDVEEMRPFLPEKRKDDLNDTLDKIKEATVCLAACQSCFTGTFDKCINVDDCAFTHDSGNTCVDCVSEQIGCRFCNSDQNTCVVEDNPCEGEYTSACTSCYQKLYNSCSQEQISCDFNAGCTNCQNNVQSCNRCFTTNYSTCSNCYGGRYNTCGEGQQSECANSWNACDANQTYSCTVCNSTLNTPPDCTRRDSCGRLYSDGTCQSGYTTCKSGDINCVDSYSTHDGGLCGGGFASCSTNNQATSCTGGTYTGDYTYCKQVYTDCSNLFACSGGYSTCTGTENGPSCAKSYRGSGTSCGVGYDSNTCQSNYNGTGKSCSSGYSDSGNDINCKSGYTIPGTGSCPNGYVLDADCLQTGCKSDYEGSGGVDCPSCYGTAYGCSGCYDVAYCSKCNTAQASCTTCVRGETTCITCVKGEEGYSEDVCNNCYAGCQAVWEQQKDCFTGNYGAAPPCTICNIGCQYCDSGCYSGQSCGDCGDCGSSNCGTSNCGSGNCGTSNCGAAQCNQSGCSNCDDIGACVCSHIGSYGCNFPIYS